MTFGLEDSYEDSQTEFKSILNDKLESEVIAFLNTKGGSLYLGVDDRGNVIGIPDDIDTIQVKIKDRLKNNISPSIVGLFEILVFEKDGLKYIQVVIAEGCEKPYYLVKKGMKPDGCFTRIGSSIQKMEQSQIDELFKNKVAPNLKEKEAPRQDLSFVQLKIYYEAHGYDINSNMLEQLDLYTSNGMYNYFAYLLSDHNNASIRFVKYSGQDIDSMCEYNDYGYVSLIKATNDILDKIKFENSGITTMDEAGRHEQKQIDYNAVREVIINAIVHNDWANEDGPQFEWYSDRLVITSYGGLQYGVSEDDFFSGRSHPKWRILMKIFTDLKLCEHIGGGIYKILRSYDRSIYTFNKNNIIVTIPFYSANTYNSKSVSSKLSQTKISILELMNENPRITREAIAQDLGINDKMVQRTIKSLKDEGYIKRVGSNKTGEWSLLKNYK